MILHPSPPIRISERLGLLSKTFCDISLTPVRKSIDVSPLLLKAPDPIVPTGLSIVTEVNPTPLNASVDILRALSPRMITDSKEQDMNALGQISETSSGILYSS